MLPKGRAWSQDLALSYRENGNNLKRMASVAPFILIVSHNSRKLEMWRLGSSNEWPQTNPIELDAKELAWSQKC